MGDAVSVLQHLAGLVENAVGVGSFAYHQVSRGVLHLRGERPDVQVVHVDHSGKVHRSEEHTSELQSLMRISYAVFCLKKKKNNNKKTIFTSRDTNYRILIY